MTDGPNVTVLADHPIWLAVPAFAPAIVVAAVVIFIAVKNRRKPETGRPDSDGGSQDGSP